MSRLSLSQPRCANRAGFPRGQTLGDHGRGLLVANFASVARSSSGQTATVEQGELTPHEAQIARLAREGHTNREIGAELLLGPRTVEWRPGKVFGKLGISSRKELRAALLGA